MASTHPRAGGPRRRRTFSPAASSPYLAAYERACEDAAGGAYLRREGLCSSLISEWRKQRGAGVLDGTPAGAKVGKLTAEQTEIARLTRELARANKRLTTTEAALDILGKHTLSWNHSPREGIPTTSRPGAGHGMERTDRSRGVDENGQHVNPVWSVRPRSGAAPRQPRAWAGLRAAELAGLQVGDVDLPARSLNPNVRQKPGTLRVERTVITVDGALVYDTPKTRVSRRRVPLTPATVELLRDYLARHPRADEPTAPLFPAMRLIPQKPTGLRATDASGKRIVPKAEDALAALAVDEAEARLTLDWDAMLRHQTFYKAVFRPAVLRANRIAAERGSAKLPPACRFHSLRHTYASLCVAAGIPPLELARFMGHAKVTTTLSVYAHLFEDDHADAMAALGAMGQPTTPPRRTDNVVPLRRDSVG